MKSTIRYNLLSFVFPLSLFAHGSTKGAVFLNYPNPTRDLVTVEFKNAGVSAIELYDLSGRKIWTQQENILATQFLLNLKDYSASIYEVRLVNKQGQFIASTTIVKQ